MVASRKGSASAPSRMARPSAPTEKSPLTGLTPECSPLTSWTSTPSPTVASRARRATRSPGRRARALAAGRGRRGVAPHRRGGRGRARPPGRPGVVQEALQRRRRRPGRSRPAGQPLAVVGVRRRATPGRWGRRPGSARPRHRLAHPVGEQRAALQHGLAVERRRRCSRGGRPPPTARAPRSPGGRPAGGHRACGWPARPLAAAVASTSSVVRARARPRRRSRSGCTPPPRPAPTPTGGHWSRRVDARTARCCVASAASAITVAVDGGPHPADPGVTGEHRPLEGEGQVDLVRGRRGPHAGPLQVESGRRRPRRARPARWPRRQRRSAALSRASARASSRTSGSSCRRRRSPGARRPPPARRCRPRWPTSQRLDLAAGGPHRGVRLRATKASTCSPRSGPPGQRPSARPRRSTLTGAAAPPSAWSPGRAPHGDGGDPQAWAGRGRRARPGRPCRTCRRRAPWRSRGPRRRWPAARRGRCR